ncbi:transmembrane protein 272-like isoform 2-T2 [Acanthopagrus schlegelii]
MDFYGNSSKQNKSPVYRPSSGSQCWCSVEVPSEAATTQTSTTTSWSHSWVGHFNSGVVYFEDCPQQPNIPNYLLGLALIPLLMIPFVTLPCESQAAQPQGPPRGFKACLGCLMALFIFTWILAGDVWVFSVYQPSYDPTAADGLYCDKTLYTFALWNAVWETFVLWFNLAKLCKGLLCWVVMSPAPANRDFYGRV